MQPGDPELEQQGAERLSGAPGRADHQQEPVGGRRHVGHRAGGHHRRAATVAVGQLAGTAAGRLPGAGLPADRRARRAAHRLQPLARLC